jgi:hypothetical protein
LRLLLYRQFRLVAALGMQNIDDVVMCEQLERGSGRGWATDDVEFPRIGVTKAERLQFGSSNAGAEG